MVRLAEKLRSASSVLRDASGWQSEQTAIASLVIYCADPGFERVSPTSANLAIALRRRSKRRRLLCLTPMFGLTGCTADILNPVGPVGASERTILLDSLAMMLCIVVPTIMATIVFAWWFRQSNEKARRLPEWTFSGRVELVTWSVPLLTIMFLGAVAWVGSHDLDPGKPLAGHDPLEVQVVSLDWKWLFILPNQRVASVNELTVPVGVPIHFSLTSASVMNSFFVPRLGSMIYTMNGMVQQLNLQADEAGTYDGLSTHFSGDGFPGMRFKVKVVPRPDFEAWVVTASRADRPLDKTTYLDLARQSLNVAPTLFREADPKLFSMVAMQSIAPGPGPALGRPSPSVTPKSKS